MVLFLTNKVVSEQNYINLMFTGKNLYYFCLNLILENA